MFCARSPTWACAPWASRWIWLKAERRRRAFRPRPVPRLGAIDILVNNAAYSDRDGIDRLDAAGLDAHYAVNLRATALLSAEFARHFDRADGGRIINITSGQGAGPMPDELAYAATKGAYRCLDDQPRASACWPGHYGQRCRPRRYGHRLDWRGSAPIAIRGRADGPFGGTATTPRGWLPFSPPTMPDGSPARSSGRAAAARTRRHMPPLAIHVGAGKY